MSEPTRIKPIIEAATRFAVCAQHGCDTEIEQMRFMQRWQPEKCPVHAAVDKEADRAEQAAEAERQRVKLRMAALGVPKLYAESAIETFQFHGTPEERDRQDRAVRFGRRYLTAWPEIPNELMLVAFRGGPGTGKGHIAWSIVKWVTTHFPATARVRRLADLIREIRATWRKGAAGDEESVLAFYRELDLLVVDEVSRHAFYGQSTQHLFDVINDRIEQCRPTILTSNESEAGLQEILGPALTDRLEGCGGLVEFGTASWRSRPREAA